MRLECRECFPRHRGLAIPTYITCRDACRDRQQAVSYEVGGGQNVPGIPGACTARNFAYLVRGPSQELSSRFVVLQWGCVKELCKWAPFHRDDLTEIKVCTCSYTDAMWDVIIACPNLNSSLTKTNGPCRGFVDGIYASPCGILSRVKLIGFVNNRLNKMCSFDEWLASFWYAHHM